MSRRSSSLNNYTDTGASREIASKYDVIKEVSEKLDEIELVAGLELGEVAADIAAVELEVQAIKDDIASGGLVGHVGPQGVKGDTGATGPQGLTGPQGAKGNTGAKGDKGDTGSSGADGHSPVVTSTNADGVLTVLVDGSVSTTLDVTAIVEEEVSANADVAAVVAGLASIDNSVALAAGQVALANAEYVKAKAAKDDAVVARLAAEFAAGTASSKASEASVSAADALEQAQEAISAKVTAETYRDDALAYLAAVNVKYDEFDDRFYGAKASNPTTDNDGFAILTGAMYWSTTDARLMIFNGGSWIPVSNSGGGLQAAQNLADLPNKATARTNLDVYSKTETTTEISNAVSALVDSSPTTLDTLNELAAALGDDPNFATTTATAIGTNAATIANEITRATNAEGTIADRVNSVNTAVGIENDTYTANPSAYYLDSATDLVDADNKLDTELKRVDDNVSVIIEAMAGLSSAQASFQYDGANVGLPNDGSEVTLTGFTTIVDSTDTNVFELNTVAGTFTIKRPGRYNWVTQLYLDTIDKDSDRIINVRLMNGTTELLHQTTDSIRIKKDGFILPLNTLLSIPQDMWDTNGGPIVVSVRMSATAGAADAQVLLTGFHSVLSSMSGVYSGFADHGQLTGTGNADSHPISAITGLANVLDARVLKTQYIKISGDVESALTEIGDGNLVTELSDSGVTAGTYGSVTVDTKGRVTAATINPVDVEW